MSEAIAQHVRDRATALTADEIERLGASLSRHAQRLNASQQRFLAKLRLFDAAQGWSPEFESCAAWVSWELGLSLGSAREKVRIAHALGHSSRIEAAYAQGELNYTQVRILLRAATPDNELELLELAKERSTAELTALFATPRPSTRRPRLRWKKSAGLVVQEARLTPEAAALVQEALQKLETKQHSAGTSSERQAAALVELARSFLAREGSASEASPSPPAPETSDPRLPSSLGSPAAPTGRAPELLSEPPAQTLVLTSRGLQSNSPKPACHGRDCSRRARRILCAGYATQRRVVGELFYSCGPECAATWRPSSPPPGDPEARVLPLGLVSPGSAERWRWALSQLEDALPPVHSTWLKAG